MIKFLISFCLLVGAASVFAAAYKDITSKRVKKSEYYISTEAVTFVQAWAFCENYGMKFISINTEVENNELLQTLDNLGISKPASFWAGGLYLQDSLLKKWYWVNGDDFTYTNWWGTTLVNGDNCLRWDYSTNTNNSKWYPIGCSNAYNFVCES